MSIIDGTDGTTVKEVIYLGTPSGSAPGDVQVYDESSGFYSGDWREFGTGAGKIDSSLLAAGDIIRYDVYTEALDVTTGGASAPQIAAGAVAVATYTDPLVYAPSVTAKYPDATSATVSAINNFTLGNDLAIAWTLAQPAVSSAIVGIRTLAHLDDMERASELDLDEETLKRLDELFDTNKGRPIRTSQPAPEAYAW